MTPTPDPLLTSAAKRLDGAWPVDMDRLEWREALVSIEAEAIGLRAAAARDALALLAAARAADIILSATEAKALSAALDAAQPAPALDVARLRAVLDNLATHHELERVAGNTHSRPDQCEFVVQARAALRGDPA